MHINKDLNRLDVEVDMGTLACELGGGMTGSLVLALHIHTLAETQYMSRSIHSVYVSQILYMGPEERVAETTASHTQIPHVHFYKGRDVMGVFFTMLCVGLSLPLRGKR